MDTILLVGTEQVSNAGYNMQSAAATMLSAASSIDISVYNLINALRDHSDKISELIEVMQETRYRSSVAGTE